MKRLLGLICALSFVGIHWASAEDLPLHEIPPLHQLHIFQSERDPNHYVFVAAESFYAGTDWFLLESTDGRLSAPRIQKEVTWMFDGFDFQLESGRRFYSSSPNYPMSGPAHTLDEALSPSLIDPVKGRESFRRLEVTPSLIDQLSLTSLVAKDELNVHKPRRPLVRPEVNGEGLELLAFEEKSGLSFAPHSPQDMIRRWLVIQENKAKSNLPYRQSTIWFSKRTNLIWTTTSLAHNLREWLEANAGPEMAAKVQPAHFNDLAVTQRAMAILLRLENEIPHPSARVTQRLVSELDHVIRSLRQLQSQQREIEEMIRSWAHHEKALQDAQLNFSQPLDRLLFRIHKALAGLPFGEAREIILMTTEPWPLSLFLDQPAGSSLGTYFDHWLDLLRSRISWVRTASTAARKSMSIPARYQAEWGQITSPPTVIRDFLPRKTKSKFQAAETASMTPLIFFGLKDSPRAREAVVRFVIEMDKEAEYQSMHLPLSVPDEDNALGNRTLSHFIDALNLVVWPAEITKKIPDFSRELYFRQVMEVVTELLNVSRTSLANGLTKHVLFNTAFGLQRQVLTEFGPAPKSRALTKQLVLLQQALQTRMARVAFGYDSLPCELALTKK